MPDSVKFDRRRALAGLAIGSLAIFGSQAAVLAQATPGATRTIVDARGEVVIPADPQRIVALGDEFLLADLLTLGVQPIASSATYAEGYIGIDPAQTAAFELPPFTLFDMDLEAILTLAPDLLVIPDYVYDMNPEAIEAVAQIVPAVVVQSIPDDWRAYIRELAAVFGRESDADDRIAEFDAALAAATDELALAGATVSLVTIYPGSPTVTAWLSDTFMPVDILQQLGAIIRPDAAGYEVDTGGRAQISLEQVNVIDGDTILMLQTAGAEDEQQTTTEITASPLWQRLPAVQADRVFILERIGFPGELSGRLQILEAYREIFGGGE